MSADTAVGNALPLWPDGSEDAVSSADDPPRLTPYLPPGPAAGAIVVCPGGGYQRRAPHEGVPVARWLNGLGIAAFVLDYRVAPHRYPAALRDARRALRLVRWRAAEWGVAGQPLGILGFSAGGHLAASAGVLGDAGGGASDDLDGESCRPDVLVLCYPVISFAEYPHQGSVASLLGDDAPAALRERLSLDRRVTAGTPPAFLWHTADDASVPVEHSLLFAGALRRHGVPFALHVFPHGRHGLGLAADDPAVGAWTGLCARWLAGHGFGNTGSVD